MAVLGKRFGDVSASAEAVTVSNPTEVALVLDNTGSMRDDMTALRKAASRFTEILFANADEDLLKVAVVPYVAAVNPGRANLSMASIDTQARSRWHAQALRGREIGFITGCDPDPFPKPVVVSNPTPPQPPVTPSPQPPSPQPPTPEPADRLPKGRDRLTAAGPLGALTSIARELLGVAAAQAQVTPRTDTPTIGQDVSPGSPYRTDTSPVIVPDGFRFDGPPCGRLRNPDRISNLDLFDRVQGVRWKGCVQARPEPYDVTDDAPSSSNPDTLFVPYFWPDEPGARDDKKYADTYVDDAPLPPGWGTGNDDWKKLGNLLSTLRRTPRASTRRARPPTAPTRPARTRSSRSRIRRRRCSARSRA